MASNYQESLMVFIGSSPNRVICEMNSKVNVIRGFPRNVCVGGYVIRDCRKFNRLSVQIQNPPPSGFIAVILVLSLQASLLIGWFCYDRNKTIFTIFT